jgi:hypothetical protein
MDVPSFKVTGACDLCGASEGAQGYLWPTRTDHQFEMLRLCDDDLATVLHSAREFLRPRVGWCAKHCFGPADEPCACVDKCFEPVYSLPSWIRDSNSAMSLSGRG